MHAYFIIESARSQLGVRAMSRTALGLLRALCPLIAFAGGSKKGICAADTDSVPPGKQIRLRSEGHCLLRILREGLLQRSNQLPFSLPAVAVAAGTVLPPLRSANIPCATCVDATLCLSTPNTCARPSAGDAADESSNPTRITVEHQNQRTRA